MKKAAFILVLGLLACITAFCGFYYLGAAGHRTLLESDKPELAWLKKQFNLSDTEFARIFKLHVAYQPHCMEMCRRIDQQNTKLQQLLAATNAMTLEIDQTIAEAAKLRGQCQRDMLQHFFEVSQTMPPAQGKRYLDWVQRRTFLSDYGMSSYQ